MIRRLFKTGNSIVLSLPREILDGLGLEGVQDGSRRVLAKLGIHRPQDRVLRHHDLMGHQGEQRDHVPGELVLVAQQVLRLQGEVGHRRGHAASLSRS